MITKTIEILDLPVPELSLCNRLDSSYEEIPNDGKYHFRRGDIAMCQFPGIANLFLYADGHISIDFWRGISADAGGQAQLKRSAEKHFAAFVSKEYIKAHKEMFDRFPNVLFC